MQNIVFFLFFFIYSFIFKVHPKANQGTLLLKTVLEWVRDAVYVGICER